MLDDFVFVLLQLVFRKVGRSDYAEKAQIVF